MNKKLNTLYTIFILLLLLTLIMPLAALPFLPDSIPAHYNGAGEVTRWGSKYETLIFPALMLPYGLLFLGGCRMTREFPSGETSERIMVIANIVQFVVFDMMIVYFLYADFRQAERLPALPDLNRILCGATGLGLIALGNWIPKLKEPGPVGLRTPWSMKSVPVWRKCQRFAGWSLVAAGAASFLAALLAEGLWCWAWTVLALLAAAIAGAAYSWHAAKTAPD